MLLAVDIGNTDIVMGLFKGRALLNKRRLATVMSETGISTEIRRIFKTLKTDTESVEVAVISSVVPSASKVVKGALRRFDIRSKSLGKEIIVPIKNLYKYPRQVGQDRLANAYACLRLYGAPAVIVDFGTATTFDYLDEKGAYCGGLITPGVHISINALYNNTALLPKIELKRPKGLIGEDTAESIRSGIVHGLTYMCEGIIKALIKESRKRTVIVATGGLAEFFAPYCSKIRYTDVDLTLKGINLIYSDVTHNC